MNRNFLRNFLEFRILRDDDLTQQLRRIDPYDVMGYVAFAASLVNVTTSIVTPYYTHDFLLSLTLLLGTLSILNRNGIAAKAALAIMLVHVLATHALRVVWPL